MVLIGSPAGSAFFHTNHRGSYIEKKRERERERERERKEKEKEKRKRKRKRKMERLIY